MKKLIDYLEVQGNGETFHELMEDENNTFGPGLVIFDPGKGEYLELFFIYDYSGKCFASFVCSIPREGKADFLNSFLYDQKETPQETSQAAEGMVSQKFILELVKALKK